MSVQHLTKCELEVMDIVWNLGRATVQDVCDHLARPLAYTTVMTTLKILETKREVVRKEKRGRAYVYVPTVTRQEVSHSLVLELKEKLFGGSSKSLVLSLLQSETLSDADVREIRKAIQSLKSEP